MKVKFGDKFGMKVKISKTDDINYFCYVEFYINGYYSQIDHTEIQGTMYFYLIFANYKSKATVVSTKFNQHKNF